ncbi:MAG: glycosyltransferase [Lachnospiraceae bacterium]|nr:glycosyltransferase [Lachnospiraceae bacterium]
MSRVALIVLNYNSYDMTVRCVDGLAAFDLGCRIIVVDNCSPDGSYERLCDRYSESEVDVIRSDRNGGYGAGNNFGIRYAIDRYGAEVAGILNPDVIISDRDMIPMMVDRLCADERYALIGGAILDSEGHADLKRSGWNIPGVWGLAETQLIHSRRYAGDPVFDRIEPGLIRTECVAGCFFLATTDSLRKIGFFDENIFLYGEEISLGIRLKEAGYIVLIAEDAGYCHDHQAPDDSELTFREKVLLTRNSYESRKYLCRRYYSLPGLVLLWCAEMYNRIYLAAAYVFHRILRRR